MDKRALLRAASILALTAAVSGSAEASTSGQDDQQNIRSAPIAEIPADLAADPLFDLLVRTNGSMTPEAVGNAIPQMFTGASAEQLNKLPQFLTSIAHVGASARTMDRAKETLMAVVASADLSDEFKDAILDRLEADLRPVQLAQRTRCDPRTGRIRNGRCEPLTTGNTRRGNDRDPGSTGQVSGGGYQ
jgi:hypothetical protein